MRISGALKLVFVAALFSKSVYFEVSIRNDQELITGVPQTCSILTSYILDNINTLEHFSYTVIRTCYTLKSHASYQSIAHEQVVLHAPLKMLICIATVQSRVLFAGVMMAFAINSVVATRLPYL